MKKKSLIIFTVIASMISSSAVNADNTEKQIDKLLSEMTLSEKIGQMNQLTGQGVSAQMEMKVKNGKVGSILNETDPVIINTLQKIAVTQSRLGIPLLFARDVIHGFKTIFPIPLGIAATWNPAMAERTARIAAIEASSVGIRWTFAPMIDISRDPRWGRIAESCGEDPYLTSIIGASTISGFQGKQLDAADAIAACAKHFAGYGASESGKDYNTTWIPEVLLRDVYLPPFQKAVNVGAASFMCSFNDINGTPSSGNKYLNSTILRKEWGFDGVLVSDWASIEQMIPHGVCNNLAEAASLALAAGVDMDMMGMAYSGHLEALIKSGKISENKINESVRNILRMKFRLGLFRNPYVKIQSESPFYKAEFLSVAEQAAAESAVLLKNEHQLLPLSTDIRSVAVVGPMSDAPSDQLGTWVFDGDATMAVTPLQALRTKFGNRLKIISEKGLTYSRDTSLVHIEKAVKAASAADVILFFAGEESILSGEAHCRADINLPGKQTLMLQELYKTGKPVVLIVMAGRPLTIEAEINQSAAVLYSFHPGTMGGPALADLIFGLAVPSGKLPVTFPKMVGQIPVYYAHKMTGRPAKDIVLQNEIPVGAAQTSLGNTSYHLDAGDGPLFPFGYGLSYTTFHYSVVQLSKSTLPRNESLIATCTVTNTGQYDASEVVQLYVRDEIGSLARPVRELKGFQKIYLKAGESKLVKFEVAPESLGFWHEDNSYSAEPGEFSLWISKDSQSGEPVKFLLK